MNEPKKISLYWVGGWASDLECWGHELDALFPEFSMHYLCAHNFLHAQDRVQALLEAAPEGSVLMGWSLGGLLVEHWLRAGRVPARIPTVTVAPFLDFCGDTSPWKPLVVRRMIRRLFGDAHGTLAEFADLCEIPEGPLRRRWMDQALSLGENELADGLQGLLDLRLDGPWHSARRLFVTTVEDRVCPAPPTPVTQTIELPLGGHVPFLNCPQLFRKAVLDFLDAAS